jgi:tetratricopeptide (TPR) repeat protein/transcriptional regulator with XRE-family HTH domain
MKERMQKNTQLRRQRLQHNWRLSDIADQLGTAVTTVQRWERGSQQPGLYYRAKLCELFDLPAWELGFGEALVPAVPSALPPSEEKASFLPGHAAEPVILWTVPCMRNPHFTGRDELLRLLDQRLRPSDTGRGEGERLFALTQVQALTGLGGVGKTQIAVEYAYQALARKCYRHTLWITATNEEAILTGFVSLADRLPAFRSAGEADQRTLAERLIHWLEQCDDAWLLIFDNVEDLSLVQAYLPHCGQGSILLTTRARAVGSFAAALEIEPMDVEEGTQCLLKRGQRFDNASEQDLMDARELALALGQLPLALDQAGAYIEETGCSIQDYLHLYQQNRSTLLARRGRQAVGYPESVVTTWSLSFQRVKEINPAAGDLLCLCALLAPDDIPQELLTEGAAHWPSPLREVAADPIRLNQLIEHVLRFSLLKRVPQERLLSIHPLVQAVQQERMSLHEWRQWAEHLVHAVHRIFPRDTKEESATWLQCQRYLGQALACEKQIREQQFRFPEAAAVLERVGSYLMERGSFLLADPLLSQALSIRKQQARLEYADLVSSMYSQAELFRKQGKYPQAEQSLLQAVRLGKRHLDPEHPLLGTVWNEFAALFCLQSRYIEAEMCYQRAGKIWQGRDDVALSETCCGLATVYREQGKYAQAEPLFIQALHSSEQRLGPDHTLVGTFLNDLANLYFQQGNYAQAEPLYQRALAIWEKRRGPDHLHVAYMLNNLTALSASQGNYEQAEAYCQRALRIWEQQGAVDHPLMAYLLNNLAKIYLEQGNYEQAEACCQRALRILEQRGTADHLQVAYLLNNLTRISLKLGNYEQAEPLCQRALSIVERYGGEMHPQMVYILHSVALLASSQGTAVEAEKRFQETLHLCEQVLGAEHSETGELLADFADFQRAHGSLQAALDLSQRALRIRECVLGVAHPLTLAVRASRDVLARACSS